MTEAELALNPKRGYNHTSITMHKLKFPNQPLLETVVWLLIKLIIYTGFVVAYYFLVLLLLRNWLKDAFTAHRVIYALVALPLIIAQAALLDFVTTGLNKIGWRKKK